MMQRFEIVGLNRGTNGRHCDLHEIIPCGSSISVGDIVILEYCTIENGERAVKVSKIEINELTCHVAFLPRAKAPFISLIVGKKAEVIELYQANKSTYKRYLDHQNCGQALVQLIE